MSSESELDLMQSTDFDDGSNNDLTVSTHLEFRDGTKPLITKQGSGHMSPVRARTMKEYDQQIAELQKENFSLKLRIYFLEERMKNQSDGDAEGVFKQNIELKVEVESLKRDLNDKQELLKKASSALTSVTSHHQTELQQTKDAGIAEGQQMVHSELDAVKLCIEGLHKELNVKNEELENLMIESKETEAKLSDLLTINRQLDSRWRQLERDKNRLEMRLELLSSTEQMTTAQEEDHEISHKEVTDEVVRKDRLIEQLRCALKAKDVIIEQVEEEKKETIKETTMELQKKIVALQARVEQEAPEDIRLTVNVESLKDGGLLKSASLTTDCEVTRLQKERKVTRKTVLLNAEVQTIASAQTTDFERLQGLLTANEQQLSALRLSLSQHQLENERLKKQIGRRDREVVQLMDQLENADDSLKKQDDQMKELRSSLQEERHKNTDKMLELDVQYKALLDDGQHHLANQNETILRLTQNLRQKDEQLEKMLQLTSLADASRTTKVAEMLRDLQKTNEDAIEELIAENSLNVKSKNEEISHLKTSLRQQTEDYGRTRKELAVCRQMMADMETKAHITDQTLQKMTNTLRDQQMELKEAKDHHGRDVSGREKLIRQLMASLPNKDKPIQTPESSSLASSDALVSSHSVSADENDLLSDLQNQLKVKEDQLQVAETRLHGLTVEMNCMRETLLKFRYSESSLVSPDSEDKAFRAKDHSSVRGAQDVGSVRTSKDSGNLSSSDSDPLSSIPEKLSASVSRDHGQEIDRNERFLTPRETSAIMTTESRNLHRVCNEDKSQQTDKASTADEEEIIRLRAEIDHLKTLVNQTVVTDSRGNGLTSTPKDGRIAISVAGKMPSQTTSPTDDVDTGAMDVNGQNLSGRISSAEKRKVHARRHLTIPPAELSTNQDIQGDSTLRNEFSVAGGSPNPNSSFGGRECRTTPPRSNISYLSVESSKRWSLEDALAAEQSGLEGNGVGQVMNSVMGVLSSFQTLLPDDSTLSEMSSAELKDVISDIKQKVLNQRKTLPQGTSLSHVSNSDASSSSRSPFGNSSSVSRHEYDGSRLRQLEKTLIEKEQENLGLNSRLEKLRTELSRSQQTIQTLENESRNHQYKSQDSPALKGELNQLREALESSERSVSQLKEQVELNTQENLDLNSHLEKLRSELSKSQQRVRTLESESLNLQSRSLKSAIPAMSESELKQLREDFESSERTVRLLKEQIELNTQVSRSSSVGFNPDLIVRMAKEIDKMKKELATKNEKADETQLKVRDHADGTTTDVSLQKIDRATVTDDLEQNDQPAVPCIKSLLDDSKMNAVDTRQRKGRRMSEGRQTTNEVIVELKSSGLDGLLEAGNRILNKSSSGSLDGKMLSGEKKSQIPILKKTSRSSSVDSGRSIENDPMKSLIPVLTKSSRSMSLNGENNESDAVKLLQLETKILMLEATIVSQSEQIKDYEHCLKEADHKRSLNSQLQSTSATTISLHDDSHMSKVVAIHDQEVPRTGSLKTADDRSDLNVSISEKIRGAQRSEVTDISLSEAAYTLPSGDHTMSSDLFRQGPSVLSTPFNDTKAANDRAFVQLKNEVQVLKSQLEMYKRENSRLNDTIQTYNEQSLWIPASSPSMHEASSRSRGTSASAEEFMRHRMESLRHESELQCHLEESHRNCDLLRTRLEELLLFMEDLLPLIDTTTPARLASLRGKLNETRSLLADVSQSFNNTYDSSSLRTSQTGSYLSRIDLDSNSTARIEEDDRSFYNRSSHSMINSVNSKDLTLSEGTSEAEHERQRLQMEMSSLGRMSRELEQHLHQKELELASVVTEAANTRSQVSELLDEMEALRMRLRGEEEKTSMMKTELVELKQCNELLAKTLEDSRRKMDELSHERDSVDKTNHHLQATFAEHDAKVSSLEQELVDCEARRVRELHQVEEDQLRRLDAFEQEHSLLITKLELLTAEIQELKLEVVRERDRSTSAEVARNSCVEKLQDKDNVIRKLKELVKENQTTAEDLGHQLHRLNEDVQEKKLTILKLNKKCEDLQNSLRQSDISSSVTRTGSVSETASTPSTNQLHNIQGSKGSKFSTQGLTSSAESFRPPGDSTVSSVLSSKVADGRDDYADRILSPTRDYLDHKPTRDTTDSSSSGHLSIVPSGINEAIIFQGRRIPSSISTFAPHDRSTKTGSVELQLIAAHDTIRLLQMELKILSQQKRSEDAKGRERSEKLEGETVEEAMEEIRQLRMHLEQSVQKNDQLRDLVMQQQTKQTGGDDALHASQLVTLSNSRDTVQSARELEIAEREISMHKVRISRLQSDLSQKTTQIEATQVEKNNVQRSLSATKLRLENALAEIRKLKDALDESSDLNRTMRLELRMQEMMKKADNKENERGLSVSPSRRSSSGSPSRLQLSDLMAEIRQLRIQMEKTIENNNILRQKLEEVSRNPQSGSTKFSDSSRTKLSSSASTVVKTTEMTDDGSVIDGIYGSQSPKSASSVHTSRHVAMEGKKRDFISAAVTDSSSPDQLVYAVADREVYERLKEELSRNQAAIGKLEESIQTIHSQVIEDDRKKDLSEVIQKMRAIANEQMQLIALFWFLNLLKPEKTAAHTTRIVENELLRKQLADLRQRYARAKHAMKVAQERLEANNRKKEEFFTMQKNKKEQAILEQISKTHQVLAQARQNLEAVHHQTSN